MLHSSPTIQRDVHLWQRKDPFRFLDGFPDLRPDSRVKNASTTLDCEVRQVLASHERASQHWSIWPVSHQVHPPEDDIREDSSCSHQHNNPPLHYQGPNS